VARSRATRSWAAALAALALLAAGCGGGGVSAAAQRKAVRATIVTFMRELAAGDGKVACGGLTAAGQNSVIHAIGPELANFGLFTCDQAVTVTGSQLSARLRRALLEVRVGAVALSGSRASVRWSEVSSAGGDLAAFFGHPPALRLVQTKGFWQIDSL
jgi:hypothetical protein